MLTGCGHAAKPGCVYCPDCGEPYPRAPDPQPQGCLDWLLAPIVMLARVYTPVAATPELDVAANLEEIRSGEPERIRRALSHLLVLGPRGQGIREVVEELRDHEDQDIALRARDVLAAMDAA